MKFTRLNKKKIESTYLFTNLCESTLLVVALYKPHNSAYIKSGKTYNKGKHMHIIKFIDGATL